MGRSDLKLKYKNKIFINSIILTMIFLVIPSSVLANGIESSTIFTGLKKLIEDLGKALIIIAIPVGTVVTAYCFIRRGAADEMDHKKWTNRITTTIVSTVGAILSGVIITLVSGYFK